jgi:hypothetical protein
VVDVGGLNGGIYLGGRGGKGKAMVDEMLKTAAEPKGRSQRRGPKVMVDRRWRDPVVYK